MSLSEGDKMLTHNFKNSYLFEGTNKHKESDKKEDSIPLVIAMIPLIRTVVPVFAVSMGLEGDSAAIAQQISTPLYWTLALGACLGGNGSLIGASANVIVAQVAKKNNYKLTFFEFTKYGFPIMIISLIVSSIYIKLRYF